MSEMREILGLLKLYGPQVLIIAFIVWQGWARERSLLARICKVEDEQRKVLLPMVEKCTRVIAKNSVIMRRLERALDNRWVCKAQCNEDSSDHD
jgi:hypothetical protein